MKAPPRRLFLLLLAGLMALGPFATDLYLPSLPAMGVALNAAPEQLTLTFSVFLIGFGAGQIIWGPLSDRFGRRPIILIGLTIFALASVACALSPNVETLIVMRFLQSLGAAAGPVGSRSSVRDTYEPAEAAGIFGLLAGIMAVVPMIAPGFGGIAQEYVGWTGNFWIMGGYTAMIAVLFLTLVPETLSPSMRQPIRPMAIIRAYRTLLMDRQIRAYMLMVSAIYAGLFAFLSGSAFVFQELYELSPSVYGGLFGIMVAGFLVGSLVTRPLTRRFGTKNMLRFGVIAIGTAGLIYGVIAIDGVGSPAAIILAQTIFALGIGIASPQISAAAMADYPHMAGTAAALQGFTQLGSGALSGFLVGLLYDGSARPMTAIIAIGCLFGTTVYAVSIARR